jgi:uncharacterized SAM-binding protein YcdF (DUF218 family)
VTRRSSFSQALLRGTAGFFGVFLILETWARAIRPDFEASLWCLDLRGWPLAGATVFTLLLSVALGMIATGRPVHVAVRWTAAATLAVGAGIALRDSLQYWHLLHSGRLHAGSLLPTSSVVTWVLGFATWAMAVGRHRSHPPSPGEATASSTAALGACVGVSVAWTALFPLLQVYGFGATDYRRHADVAVVFGARVYADGQPSMALADRVDTAVQLYRQGWVPRLLFSGGPGDGTIHETESMRRRAIDQGVPPTAIELDPAGLNTAATVRNTAEGLRHRRALAVSEFYHLPRIKLAYAARSIDVQTVPAQASHWLRRWAPANVLREIPAFWSYYLRALRPLPGC